MLHKMRHIVRTHGFSGLAGRSVSYAYRRAVLPRGAVHYAGIPICYDRKWPEYLADQPKYEAALIAGLSEMIRPGDSVVVVGGGLGVTAVVAALRTGQSGHVQCFEGSGQHVSLVRETAARNGVTNISVHHAVVAKSIALYDGSDAGPILHPSRLPPCNVLQMDCEGAEVEILRELRIQPRVILVETHGMYGAPTDLVATLLGKLGYVVSDRGVADTRLSDECVQNDVRVLLGSTRHF
jgi:hypothetical protein